MATDGIPRIINHMWLDKEVKDNDTIPEKYRKLGYAESWKTMNPGYQYKLWNQVMVDDLFKDSKLAKWKDFFYNGMKEHIEKCDFARYAVMIVQGGLYVDLDFKCMKPIEPLMAKRSIGLVWEPVEHTNTVEDKIPRRLYNGFFMSKPGHWIWPAFMDFIMKNYKKGEGPLNNTGPVAFARFAKSINLTTANHPDFFLETCEIIPVISQGGVAGICKPNALDDAYSVTYWHDGSGWGATTLADERRQQINEERAKAGLPPLEATASSNARAFKWTKGMTILFVLIGLVLATSGLAFVFYKMKNRDGSVKKIKTEKPKKNKKEPTSITGLF